MSQKVYIPHYLELLEKTSMSYNDRKFYEKVLKSIEKRGGYPTYRQQMILDKIKNG